MEIKLLGTALAVPLAAVGLVLGMNSAEAASITGPGELSIFGNVVVTGNIGADNTPGTADDLFTFNFGGTTEVGDEAIGGLSDFSGTTASIRTFVLPPANFAPGGSTFPIADFLALDENDSFTLTDITTPTFTTRTTPGGGLTTLVQYSFDGTWTTESGATLPGQGIFTSQFTGSAEDRLAQLVSGTRLVTTYSGSFEAVPEPLTIAGASMAAGFGILFRKKIREKLNAKKN